MANTVGVAFFSALKGDLSFSGRSPSVRFFNEEAIHCVDLQVKSDKSGYFINYGFHLSFIQPVSMCETGKIAAQDCEGRARIQVNSDPDKGIASAELDSDFIIKEAVKKISDKISFIGRPREFFSAFSFEDTEKWHSFVRMTDARRFLFFARAYKFYNLYDKARNVCDQGLSVVNRSTAPYSQLQSIKEEIVKLI